MRVLVGVLALLVLAAVGGATGGPTAPCAGRIADPANGTTVVSVQGQKFAAGTVEKTPARLIAFGPEGRIRWVHRSGRELGVVWSYDVDPLPNGTLFVTATRPGRTLVYELDPRTGEILWTEELPYVDTHDADLLGGGRILVAHMRNYRDGENRDRLAIYDRTSDETVWTWRFADHYPRRVGGNYTDDWTHVNDVDRIAPGRYLASPRNLDQVIVVNRSGAITLKLGADDRHGIMREQHNPVYLEGENGTPTVLVADSGNDRIVEYARSREGWERTWRLGNGSLLAWPRDADRLPNGNTLIADSRNDRVIEVTPGGRVVWEVYAPWLVYDVERVRYGDEAGGPTVREQNATGAVALAGEGARPWPTGRIEACAAHVRAFPATRTTAEGRTTGKRDSPDPTTTPVGVPGVGVPGALAALALLAAYRS